MDETQFLLFKKLVELCASQELRIIDLEKRLTGSACDRTEIVEELKELIKELPGVHFPDPNCDWEDAALNSMIDRIVERQNFLERNKPQPVPFPEDDYF